MTSTTADTMAVTIKVSQATKQWVEDEAERWDLPRDRVIEQLVEEAVRMRRFPRIGFREEGPRRRACVLGTRFDVWATVDALREMGRERILAESTLSSYDLDAVETYYEAYQDEIDREIEGRIRALEELERRASDLNIKIIEF